MLWRLIAIAAALGLAGPVQSAPAPPAKPAHVVVNPSWIRQPTIDEMTAVFPTEAILKGIEGHVVIECRVLADETLTDCKVVSETPTGQGFGQAALLLPPTMRLHPEQVDGVPTSKGEARIPIAFKVDSLGFKDELGLTIAEKCVGDAAAYLDSDHDNQLALVTWTHQFVAGAHFHGASVASIIDRIDESRILAQRDIHSERGDAQHAACRKYSDVIAKMGQRK